MGPKQLNFWWGVSHVNREKLPKRANQGNKNKSTNKTKTTNKQNKTDK